MGESAAPTDRVIIVMPTYNERQNLEILVPALTGVLDSTALNYELVFVDDGSRDETVEVARGLGVHHVLSLGSNRGLAKAFAAGIQHGEHVTTSQRRHGEVIDDLLVYGLKGLGLAAARRGSCSTAWRALARARC